MELEQAIAAAACFINPDSISEITAFGQGHINDTYRVRCEGNPDILLQRVNHQVFVNIPAMENNMACLEGHFDDTMIPTVPAALQSDQGSYIRLIDGNYWRCYIFQQGMRSYEAVTGRDMLAEAGWAFGKFIRQISPLDSLQVTLVDFHHIPTRLAQLNKALSFTTSDKKIKTSQLVQSVEERIQFLQPLIDLLGDIPQRNVHNDTKINNLLFDANGKARYVVDLDTVMPGYVHYDLGDALRTTATNLPEDGSELHMMKLDMEGTQAFVEGFIKPLRDVLSQAEKNSLYLSPVYMSLIMGIRFLTDYLNGDIYYKTSYPDQNFNRASNQIHLAGLFESAAEELRQMIDAE